MWHLLTGLLSELTRKDEYSIVILGLDAAGKTTFLEKVKSHYSGAPGLPPERIHPTIGQNIGRVALETANLQFWDLGGQRELRSLWPKYYSECHAVCFIVDSTDAARMDETWRVFDEIVADRHTEGLPTLVLANKQDDPKALAIENVKERFNKHVNKMSVSDSSVMGMSALKGDGIAEAVDWLLVRIKNNKRLKEHEEYSSN